MVMNQLKDSSGARKKSKRLGRGIGSGKGKTCARGGKGQTARSGVAINGFEGGQMPIHRRLPKRGFKSLNRFEFTPVNLGLISELVELKVLDAANVDIDALIHAGVVKSHSQRVKILADGGIAQKVCIKAHAISKSAAEALSKAGGQFININAAKSE